VVSVRSVERAVVSRGDVYRNYTATDEFCSWAERLLRAGGEVELLREVQRVIAERSVRGAGTRILSGRRLRLASGLSAEDVRASIESINALPGGPRGAAA
jgi:hypothetical protein